MVVLNDELFSDYLPFSSVRWFSNCVLMVPHLVPWQVKLTTWYKMVPRNCFLRKREILFMDKSDSANICSILLNHSDFNVNPCTSMLDNYIVLLMCFLFQSLTSLQNNLNWLYLSLHRLFDPLKAVPFLFSLEWGKLFYITLYVIFCFCSVTFLILKWCSKRITDTLLHFLWMLPKHCHCLFVSGQHWTGPSTFSKRWLKICWSPTCKSTVHHLSNICTLSVNDDQLHFKILLRLANIVKLHQHPCIAINTVKLSYFLHFALKKNKIGLAIQSHFWSPKGIWSLVPWTRTTFGITTAASKMTRWIWTWLLTYFITSAYAPKMVRESSL